MPLRALEPDEAIASGRLTSSSLSRNERLGNARLDNALGPGRQNSLWDTAVCQLCAGVRPAIHELDRAIGLLSASEKTPFPCDSAIIRVRPVAQHETALVRQRSQSRTVR